MADFGVYYIVIKVETPITIVISVVIRVVIDAAIGVLFLNVIGIGENVIGILITFQLLFNFIM